MKTAELEIPTARVFLPLLEPARDKGAWGGRGSGKSHFFAGMMIEDSLAEPGNSAGEGLKSICIREVQKDLAQSSKALIEAKLASLRLGEADGFKAYRDVIRTPGDGLIIFKGMNDYTADSVKSLEGFKRAWWEEAQTASATSIKMLRPTMRTSGAQMWWSWNARKKTDPVDVMLRGPEKPKGAIVVEANWRDNPWFSDELEQERADCLRMTPDDYAHVWEGGYVTVASGAYYAKCLNDARLERRIGRVAKDPLMQVRAFWDLGGTGAKSDATAIWIAQFIGREIRVLDYYEAQGQPLATHIAWLRERGWENALCVLPHDGTTNDRVHDASFESALRQAGFDVIIIANQGAGAAKMRIEAGRRLFPMMWFHEETTQGGIDALGWYHEKRDDKRDIGLGPEHDWSSHGADAFGLMCVAYEQPAGKPKDTGGYRGSFGSSTSWMAG